MQYNLSAMDGEKTPTNRGNSLCFRQRIHVYLDNSQPPKKYLLPVFHLSQQQPLGPVLLTSRDT